MPTISTEIPHYYAEEPSFVGGHLVRRGGKFKTHALPSIAWRPLNEAAFEQVKLVREETFEYEVHMQDGTTKIMTHQPRLMAKTLGGGRGSLASSPRPENALLEDHEEAEPHLGEGQTLAEVALKGNGRSQDQRPGPTIGRGPEAFVHEPTPPGEPEETETGADGVVITARPPVGAGYGKDGISKTTSKGSPVAPAKDGVVE